MADTLETYRTVTPYLVVPDADAELRFLAAAFDATEQSCQRNADNTVMHAEVPRRRFADHGRPSRRELESFACGVVPLG